MIDKNKIAKAARQISEKVVDANGFMIQSLHILHS